MHQNFYATHLGTFGANPNHHILKTTNFIVSKNSPTSHLAKSGHTAKLGQVQNPPNSKLLCTKTFMVLIWGNLEAILTTISQKPRISFFFPKLLCTKTPRSLVADGNSTSSMPIMCRTTEHIPDPYWT